MVGEQFNFERALDGTLCRLNHENIYDRAFDMTDRQDYQAFLNAGGHSETGCFKTCGVAGQAAAENILALLQERESKA